ncbi:MAG: MEDS domain-containing protein [Kofleriaceae bacterium]|nr:MEDS domain-containing protein [Kofleriaceae bacterium]
MEKAHTTAVGVPPFDPTVMPGPMRPHHFVQFYEGEGFLAEIVASFLGSGLGAGHHVVVVATPAQRAAFCAQLENSFIDVDRARTTGRLVLIDAEETLAAMTRDGFVDAQRFEIVIGGLLDRIGAPDTHIRIYGEMVELLWQRGQRSEAIRLEQMWNDLGHRRPFSLLCAYQFAHFENEIEGEGFRFVCEAHTHVIPTESYAGLREPESRLREVSHLQQRAAALGYEIARRMSLEDELTVTLSRERAARTEAEAAGRAKDEFLAMLGHELRNPLAPIITAVELARLRGWEGRELDVLERQSQHMVRLIDDLLDISRITRGKIELRREYVTANQMIAGAIEAVSPITSVDNDLATIGDPARLVQVLANLLMNACKYSDEETVIQLAVGAIEDRIRIRVRDQGIGIEASMLQRIFDTFVQQAQGMDRAQGGLGLGLSIARSLVELHGGFIIARSEGPGCGSEFEVDLPLARPDDTLPIPTRERDLDPFEGIRLRILVVDDNEDAGALLAEALLALGHDVRAVIDGPSALRVARDHRPELAFIDLGLPAMDGYELAKHLRAEPWAIDAKLQLVAVTGYGQDADKQRTRASGFLDHLVKPVDIAGVVRSIRLRAAQQ